MAWFLNDDTSSALTPFRVHVVADSTSVSLDADYGETGVDGTLILYNRGEGSIRRERLAIDADVTRWATSVAAVMPRSNPSSARAERGAITHRSRLDARWGSADFTATRPLRRGGRGFECR